MTVLDQADLARIRVQLPRVFTPGAPISRRDFLAGRKAQIDQIIGAVSRPGQHTVIYGERGVGKTSLAGLVHEFWLDASRDQHLIAVRINCDPLDDYATIWANIAEEIQAQLKSRGGEDDQSIDQLAAIIAGQATPNIIRRMFQSTSYPFIVVIDEFDRINDEPTVGLLADTIKSLSDHWVNATLIIVGVADSLDELLHEHASIDRALIQVPVRRMNTDELNSILSNGVNSVGMTLAERARAFITRISQGLPYYVHLLGLTSALVSLAAERTEITFEDVVYGLRDAVDNAEATVGSAYYQATVSPRKDNLYKEVLLACTLAPVDALGYFQPASIREPLESIVKRECQIGTYTRQLEALSSDRRGSVLQKSGEKRRQRFRFKDPLLKPYILLRGLEDGLLEPD